MLSTLIGLLLAGNAAAGDYTFYQADGTYEEIIGWSDDGTLFAVDHYNTRSGQFLEKNPSSPKDCEGYERDGAAFAGDKTVFVYELYKVKTRFPVLDGNKCTHPDDVKARQDAMSDNLSGLGIQMGKTGSKITFTDKAFTLNNERFMVSSGSAVEAGPDAPGKFKIPVSVRFRVGEIKYEHVVTAAKKPKISIDYAVVSPDGRRIVFMHTATVDKGDAVQPLLIIEKDGNGWKQL